MGNKEWTDTVVETMAVSMALGVATDAFERCCPHTVHLGVLFKDNVPSHPLSACTAENFVSGNGSGRADAKATQAVPM